MKKLTVFCVLLFIASQLTTATTYYIRTDGNDANSGRENTMAGAWKTWGTSFNKLVAGDVLNIADGTYSEDQAVCTDKIASRANPITIKAINKWGAKLASRSIYNAMRFNNSVGIVLDGLEVYFNRSQTSQGGNGIDLEQTDQCTVRNCNIHDCFMNGVGGNGDNLIIENNYIHHNSWGNVNSNENGSGITVGVGTTNKANLGTPFGVIVRNNIIYHNYATNPCCGATPGSDPTDGNGIIVDCCDGYTKGVLIENNLVYDNGGRGIHALRSGYVTIRNNTCYHNSWELTKWNVNSAEIFAEGSVDGNIKIYNNITVEDPNLNQSYTHAIKSDSKLTTIINNILVGDVQLNADMAGCALTSCGNSGNLQSTTQTYPSFVNPGAGDYTVVNFHIQSTSPAINAGYNSNAATADYDGDTRPQGAIVDIGYDEYVETQPPSAPSGLTSSNIGSSSFTLSWTASSGNVGVTGYEVFKGGISVGTATSTSLNVTGLTCATSYSITVKARDAAGNGSTASAPLSVTTLDCVPCVLPTGWTGADIGTTGGQSCESAGTFTIDGSGADIWDVADQFRYTYKSLAGNGTIVAQVLSIQNTDPWAKAGVMIRESLTAGSVHADCYVTSGNGASFQIRPTTGASTTNTIAAGITAPYWVKLERAGNAFSAYHSVNGNTWIQVGTSATVTMGTNVYIGLAVTSHSASTVATSTLSNVTITAGTTKSHPTMTAAIAVNRIGIFQNSKTSKLTIANLPGNTRIAILSLDGRMISNVYGNTEGLVNLNVTGWNKGVYLFRFQLPGGSVDKKIMIK